MVTGNEKTKTSAVEKALTVQPNKLLRADDLYTSEQNLYASDAFSRIDIQRRPAGDTANGRVPI